jgi:hypothetical protein
MSRYKIIFLGILVLPFVSTFGQHKRFDFSVIDTLNKELKHELMEKVKDEFPFNSESKTWPQDSDDYYHFIDVDNDSDLDLIYDGWSGSEPMTIMIFLNKNGIYVNVFTQFIDIENIEIKNHELKRMEIYNPGCCLAIMAHEYVFEFKMGKDLLSAYLTEHYIYHNETQIPKKYFEKPIKFEVANPQYELRITPQIDTSSNYIPDESYGNRLRTYKTGDKGIALAEESDETGRVWWYVIMDNQEERKYKMDNPDVYPAKYEGWMSSRFLKRID